MFFHIVSYYVVVLLMAGVKTACLISGALRGWVVIQFDWPEQALGLQGLVSSWMVHIYPSGWVLLAAEGLEVVAHRGGHADFKVVFAFLEVMGDVVDSTTKILDTS